MGFSITWCAVLEDAAAKFLHDLELTPTGETEEVPESPFSTARLDTGWRVVWANAYESPFLDPKRMATLSKERDVLLCLVEEHAMASSAEYWSGGSRVWWIGHEGENGPKGLSTDGALPEGFDAIRSAMEDAQRAEGGDDAGVDYLFEIPLKVAEALVGFKHDEAWPHVIGEQFEVLSGPEPAKKGLLGRIFGR